MYVLFNNTKENIKNFLKELTIEDIEECCDSRTFSKGEDYYDSECVYEVCLSSETNLITATVEGNEEYKIKIHSEKKQITGSCTCPVDGICKHLIAVLLFCVNEPENIEFLNPVKKGKVNYQSYLETLSKEKLIELIMKYAPKQFFIEIGNSFSGNKEAVNVFMKVQKAIQRLFKDSDLLYSPSEFEGALLKQINLLKGLEKHLKKEIGELIMYVVNEIDSAFDEGYLYTDGYNEDYFTSEDFEKYIIKYATSLEFEERIIFLQNLGDLLNNQNYDTFHNIIQLYSDAFNEKDIPHLKEKVLKNIGSLALPLKEKFYEILRSTLSFDEKEFILKILSENSDEYVLELAEMLKNGNRISDAIKVLKKYISKTGDEFIDEKIFMLFLDLMQSQGNDISKPSLEAITRCSTDKMLLKIAQLKSADIKLCEDILKRKNPEKMLDYYEKTGRLNEALTLINESKDIWSNRVFEFYKSHKKEFSSDAENFFRNIIDKNLLSTGDSYYHAIVDALKQINQINPALVKEMCEDIRKNYNRRRNLMQLISNF